MLVRGHLKMNKPKRSLVLAVSSAEDPYIKRNCSKHEEMVNVMMVSKVSTAGEVDYDGSSVSSQVRVNPL
jgi:hypothetical protein